MATSLRDVQAALAAEADAVLADVQQWHQDAIEHELLFSAPPKPRRRRRITNWLRRRRRQRTRETRALDKDNRAATRSTVSRNDDVAR
jgi:predicted RNA polymerase sigma factor